MDLITMVLACSLYTDNSITNAMVQVGSHNNSLAVRSTDGLKIFKTQSDAINYTNTALQQGNTIDIGIMQIPSRWAHASHSAAELFAPCKNMVVATKILNQAMDRCSELSANDPSIDEQACALSIYKTGNPQAGLDYANAIISYAKAHSFDAILAAAKAKNPKEFKMLAGDAATTAATPNATKLNPSTDPRKAHKVVAANNDTDDTNATTSSTN